ncbi:MAG TPA: GAF domain-containing protein, partial [Burkholderiaceae bacterium]
RLLLSVRPDVDPTRRTGLQARLDLVQGEVRLLAGEPGAAREAIAQAADVFEALGDFAGLSDAMFLEAQLEHELGHYPERDAAIARAALYARTCGDDLRGQIADARAAHFDSFDGIDQADARWGQRVAQWREADDPCLRRIALEYLAVARYMRSELPQAITLLREAAAAGESTGHWRDVCNDRADIGWLLSNLGEYDGALDCFAQPIRHAREARWPRALARSLEGCARVLMHLNRVVEARRMVQEAARCLRSTFPNGDLRIGVLQTAGEIAVLEGRLDEALASFRRQEGVSIRLRSIDGQMRALILQADVLGAQRRADVALQAAESARALVRMVGSRQREVEVLQVIARLHRELMPERRPPEPGWPSAELHFLHEALALAERVDGFQPSAQLLRNLARAHADIEDFEQAHAFCVLAARAFERENDERAVQRAVGLEIRRQTEQAERALQHQMALAREQALRTEALQRHNETLMTLAAVGQDLTCHLEEREIFDALVRHARAMLDATAFAVFMLEPDGRTLCCRHGVEAGEALPPLVVALEDPGSNIAACARARQPLVRHYRPEEPPPSVAGCRQPPSLSALFAPLLVGERLLGVVTLQSPCVDAYREREQTILGALA